MEILYNKEGTPLLLNSTYFFGETDQSFENAAKDKIKTLIPFPQRDKDYWVNLNDYKVMRWGENNDFPQLAVQQIETTSVLNTGLKFLRNLTLGQGIFPCKVKGYDDDGNEVLEPINDEKLNRFVGSRMVRRCLEHTLRDYLCFGNGAVHFVPSMSGGFAGLNPLNALFRRFTEPNNIGSADCIVSGFWPELPQQGGYLVYPLLSEYDPEMDADLLKFKGKMKNGFVYPVRDSWSSRPIYSMPIWFPAFVLGWIDIAHLIPAFLKKAYKNQVTWKWHVQIPYSFWDKRFPPNDYQNPADRKTDIQKYMDNIELNLCGVENAEKPIFTNYAVNEMNGKIEEEWKITPLENKYQGSDNLPLSAAANSEILFALMVNPNVLGAGMPGGTYAGNQGGSNIREAFLVNVANAWIDRQNILDPIELFIKLNGMPDCELRFRNTILVTLDHGSGTKKTLS